MLKEGKEKGREECTRVGRRERRKGRQEGVTSGAGRVGRDEWGRLWRDGVVLPWKFPRQAALRGWNLGEEKAEWEALLSWYPAAANITVRRDIWADRKR